MRTSISQPEPTSKEVGGGRAQCIILKHADIQQNNNKYILLFIITILCGCYFFLFVSYYYYFFQPKENKSSALDEVPPFSSVGPSLDASSALLSKSSFLSVDDNAEGEVGVDEGDVKGEALGEEVPPFFLPFCSAANDLISTTLVSRGALPSAVQGSILKASYPL